MLNYTPRQLAKLANLSSRQITSLCTDGTFPGAHKDAHSHWRIPQAEAIAWLDQRQGEVDVLTPAEVENAVVVRNEELLCELMAEARKKAEEVLELQKQVEELGGQLLGVSGRLAELEAEKRKPSWWARLWGNG